MMTGKIGHISRIILVDDNQISGHVYMDLLVDATGIGNIQRYYDLAAVVCNEGRDAHCLIVINFDLISSGGFSAITMLRENWPNATIVIVSGAPDREPAVAAFAAGAAAYLPRTFSGKAVGAVLRLVLEGECFIPAFPSPERREGEPADGPLSRAAAPEAASDLTLRQREILQMIAQGAPNKTIARSLGISHVTVKSHLSRIYRTLGVSSRTQAARRCLLHGDGRHVRESPFIPPPHVISPATLRILGGT